jgi:DNA-binding transcriptional ArsR family regulator
MQIGNRSVTLCGMDPFAALADPIRRDLLLQLRRGPARVTELADEHPVSRPAISRHLRILREANLVEVVDAGRERHYSLRTDPLDEVAALVRALAEPMAPIGHQMLDALDTEVRRTRREHSRRAGDHAAPTAVPHEESA